MDRSGPTPVILILAAGGLLAAAGLLQFPLDSFSEAQGLVAPGNVVAERNPQLAILTTVFGGLRAPVSTFLWIRAEKQKQEGRYFDSMQTADLICQLMPRFPGVWDYHAWNMAWNISVQTHTPEERWLWVTNGVRLLRDRGIPLNPRALRLYKQLAWILYEKMGGGTDDMHWEYKRRWAMEMQELLGALPPGTVKEVIDAFRPIADESLLDKDPRRQGRREIQPDKFAQLVAMDDGAVGRYLLELRSRFADGDPRLQAMPMIDFVNRHLLELYNHYSMDESVTVARPQSSGLKTDRDKSLFGWINDGDLAPYLRKALAFVRAQRLWNVYKMDPAWMLELMEYYNIPLDWRMVRSHGAYWNSYGLKVCKNVIGFDEIQTINTGRTLTFCLRDMAFYGKLAFQPDPGSPREVTIMHLSDWRFVDPAQRYYLELIDQLKAADAEKEEFWEFKDNPLAAGHVNFLIDAISMLYRGGRRQKAQQYLDWTKENYERTGKDWDLYLDEFVRHHLRKDFREGPPTQGTVISQITAAVQGAFESLLDGRAGDFQKGIDYARYVRQTYLAEAPKRLRKPIPEFDFYAADVLASVLIWPRTRGIDLDLADRIELYNALRGDPEADKWLVLIYDAVAPQLEMLCRRAGRSFERAFPPPVGLEAHRRRLEQAVPP